MHMAVVEFARNVLGWKEAHTAEIDPNTPYPVIYLMREWFDYRSQRVEKRDELSEMGGTMRLGAYPCNLIPETNAAKAYRTESIEERHRHRFEFNNEFKEELLKNGLVVSGTSPDGELVEIVELADHPWFLGCQFHPEFKSRPMNPHPLFRDYIKAALRYHNDRQNKK
jgi:CTP synthase